MLTHHVIPGQAHGVTPAGNKSEPSPCNTLGTRLEPARPVSFPDDLNLELASFSLALFSQDAWGSSAQDGLSYPTQLNIWPRRAGSAYASSCCFGSRHILIAHTPGAGFLLSYVNRSGGCQLDGSEYVGCFLTLCFPGVRTPNHPRSNTAEGSAPGTDAQC